MRTVPSAFRISSIWIAKIWLARSELFRNPSSENSLRVLCITSLVEGIVCYVDVRQDREHLEPRSGGGNIAQGGAGTAEPWVKPPPRRALKGRQEAPA